MDSYLFQKKCKEYLIKHYKENFKIHLELEDIYVVWSCKTLQNNKALISTVVSDGRYFEFTYNGDKDETYFDAYVKEVNGVVNIGRKYNMKRTIRFDLNLNAYNTFDITFKDGCNSDEVLEKVLLDFVNEKEDVCLSDLLAKHKEVIHIDIVDSPDDNIAELEDITYTEV